MSQSKYQTTISEALLRQAIIDNFEQEMAEIPSNEELEKTITFSERHNKRMKKLFRRVRMNELMWMTVRVTRKAAAVVAIVVSLVFGALMFNPTVRAAVVDVIIEVFEKYTTFRFTGEAADRTVDWVVGYLPDGYSKMSENIMNSWTVVTYSNTYTDTDEGIIRLIYYKINSSVSQFSDNEERNFTVSSIGGKTAYLYESTDDTKSNAVIWTYNGYAFDLSSQLDIVELVKVAASVEQKK